MGKFLRAEYREIQNLDFLVSGFWMSMPVNASEYPEAILYAIGKLDICKLDLFQPFEYWTSLVFVIPTL